MLRTTLGSMSDQLSWLLPSDEVPASVKVLELSNWHPEIHQELAEVQF